ncbi:helix-turn-helix transcriptional regulator [Catellatospora sp. NPDC049133]|uniref:helix-turn-helix domain-containing protein n=1 Tax=Catellatospora sp. NPDC049133 TaxID=3155499 RepID=UPI0033DA934D
MPHLDRGPVDKFFAINLRRAREAKGMSQADLAERVTELGHSFTQATVWKLEQGNREPKLSEAVAIGRALDLGSWTELTAKPETFDVAITLDHWRARMHQLAAQTRAAAAAQIEAQVQLTFAVRAALDAGLPAEWADGRSGGWLEFTPEVTVLHEVLAARVAWESADDEHDARMAKERELIDRIVNALVNGGVPMVIEPQDIRIYSPGAADDDEQAEDREPSTDTV